MSRIQNQKKGVKTDKDTTKTEPKLRASTGTAQQTNCRIIGYRKKGSKKAPEKSPKDRKDYPEYQKRDPRTIGPTERKKNAKLRK